MDHRRSRRRIHQLPQIARDVRGRRASTTGNDRVSDDKPHNPHENPCLKSDTKQLPKGPPAAIKRLSALSPKPDTSMRLRARLPRARFEPGNQ
ncbi:hypothetical protein [Mesorhizobium sp. B2-7-2]|uniref:hypothetical protein n=1 Tax=Mesorhizobium sp. B2-7-2 TaxID=2589908 RepID=UPI0015E31A0E|nr:hypothetical protein [Mesorhizobium sp. B2-7-2]